MARGISEIFHYWKGSVHGPRSVVVVFEGGKYNRFDFMGKLDQIGVGVDWVHAIGIACLVPATNEWSIEFQGPEQLNRGSGSFKTEQEAVQEIFDQRKKTFEDHEYLKAHPEAELEQRLQRHDWTYMYSDDHRVWSAGNDNMKRIRELMGIVPPETATALWAKYAQ